jgi:RND superfamily putative drug exporter
MAFGILLASLVVSSVLVPALTALAGQRAWWPRGTKLVRAPAAYARTVGLPPTEGRRIRGAPSRRTG